MASRFLDSLIRKIKTYTLESYSGLQNGVIFEELATFLTVNDVKNLRLVCRRLSDLGKTELRRKSAVHVNLSDPGFLLRYDDFEKRLKFGHTNFNVKVQDPSETAVIIDFVIKYGKSIKYLKMTNWRWTGLENDAVRKLEAVYENCEELLDFEILWNFYSKRSHENDDYVAYQWKRQFAVSNHSSSNERVKGKVSLLINSMCHETKYSVMFKNADYVATYKQYKLKNKQNFGFTLTALVLQLRDNPGDQSANLRALSNLCLCAAELRLKTFEIYFCEYNSDRIFANFEMLVNFLNSQETSLENLKISRIQNCFSEHFTSCNNPPWDSCLYKFPRMVNLRKLGIRSYLATSNQIRFIEENWLSKFPNLETLECTYMHQNYDTQKLFTDFLAGNRPHQNLKFVRVNLYNYFHHPNCGQKFCKKLYTIAKAIFPNLVTVTFNDGFKQERSTYSGNRFKSSFYSYADHQVIRNKTNMDKFRIRQEESSYFSEEISVDSHVI